jgi:hypothetical protein
MAARGYSSAQRKRGSVQTEHAVGRHRLKAIESSVVRPVSTTDGFREVKTTEGEVAKAAESSAEPN